MLEHLFEIANRINETVKYGKYHEKWIGNRRVFLSPRQAFEEFYLPEGVRFIPPEYAHLFKNNKLPRTVGRNGVRFDYGRRTFAYDSGELQMFRGRDVLCWFSPQDSSVLSVTSMDLRTRFAVPVVASLPHDATPEQNAAEAARKAGCGAYHRDVHRALKPAFRQDFTEKRFRFPIVDSMTSGVIEDLRVAEETVKAEQKTRKNVRRKAGRMGITVPDDAPVSSESNDKLSRVQDFLRKHGQEVPEA